DGDRRKLVDLDDLRVVQSRGRGRAHRPDRRGCEASRRRRRPMHRARRHRDLSRTFTADELARMPIKPAAERRLIGRTVPALDIPAKTDGTARYGIDAKVDGMVYARPKIPPTRNGCTVRSIDDSAARSVKGYVSSLALDDPSGTVPGWVIVFAETYPAAIRAADRVKVDWAVSDATAVSEQDILDHGAKQI